MRDSVPYLVAGFGLTWIVVVVYAWRLEARLGRVRDRLRRHGEAAPRVEAPGGGTAGDRTGADRSEGPEEAR